MEGPGGAGGLQVRDARVIDGHALSLQLTEVIETNCERVAPCSGQRLGIAPSFRVAALDRHSLPPDAGQRRRARRFGHGPAVQV